MFDPFIVIAVFLLYIGCLFLFALWAERSAGRGKSLVNNPVIYTLALAVYCTAWTYYGCVGAVVKTGMLFSMLYIGPVLAIILWWVVLRKMVRIKNSRRITSIADFISARYDKSPAVAAIVTIIAIVGIMPYIALQLKAIFSTFALITITGTTAEIWIEQQFGIIVVVLMIIFTIIFGVRKLDPTEHHEGMVMALAVESIVKITALLIVGVFVTFFLFGGFGDFFQHLSVSQFSRVLDIGEPGATTYVLWFSYIVLAMSSILFLPRQFHVAVIENSDERHILTTMWLFPLYMLLISVFMVPIAMGGLLMGLPATSADSFTLLLPLNFGNSWLALLTFIGGFAAATGMVMIETMTLSTMITNHLMLPLIERAGSLSFLRRHILKCRWVAVALVILLGYWFEQLAGESYTLVNIGIISFAAVLQFAPAILGGIFWKRGNKAGAILGLTAGFVVWLYTLLIPSFVKSGWLPASLLENGPWGLTVLMPEHLFGLTGFDPISHAVFWTMFFNIGLYVLGSLCFSQSKEEENLSEEFVGALTAVPVVSRPVRGEGLIDLLEKRTELENVLSQYLSSNKSVALTNECIRTTGLEGKSRIHTVELVVLHNEVEKCLSGSIGAASAREAMRRGIILTPEEATDLSEVYTQVLSELKVTPDELRKKIDYYKEKETLLTSHSHELEEKIRERDEQIAERRKAEEALRESEEQFRNVVETQTEFICRFRPDGTHVFVNEAYCRYFGKNCSEFIGKKFTPEIPPEDRVKVRDHFASLSHDHPVSSIDHRIIMPDGSLRWQRWVDRAIYDEQSNLTEYQTVGRDITDIKQAEMAIRDSENKLNAIVRGSPIPLFVIDRDHKVIKWNEALEIYSGIPAEQVLGTNQQWRAFYPDERPCIADLLVEGQIEKIPQWYSGKYTKSKLIDAGYEATDFFPHMGPSGTWLHFTAAPIWDSNGSIIGAVETLEDITERKNVEERVRKKAEELARSNAELEQFAYIASHDLQEPLRMIASYLQLIERRYKGQLDSNADEFIGYAVDGAKRQQNMINGLLDFSRVQSRGMTFAQTDCEELLKDVMTNEKIAIRDSGAVITHDPLPVVWADAGQLIRIFQNLVENAIKFRGKEAPAIHISAERQDKYWVFSVRDNGIGFEPEYKDKLFILFRRLHTTEYPGTGIGLAVCKRIIERHGGKIWVESIPEKGTTFYFSVPVTGDETG